MSVISDNRRTRSAGKEKKDFSSLVFWMLLLAGLAVSGVCIIAPAWLNCQQLAAQQLELTKQLENLHINKFYHQEAIEAARRDVAFNERLLIEELNYHRPGEQALLLASKLRSTEAASGSNHISPQGPAWLRAFAERDTRDILLVMSTGLVLFAFVYYRPTKRSAPPSNIPVRPAPARFVSSASNCYSR